MPSRHLLDPELHVLTLVPEETDIARLRAGFSATRVAAQSSDRVSIRAITIPGPEGDPEVPCLLYEPRAREARCGALLHIHGGGYITGAAEMAAPANLRIAEEFGVVILSVDYRLAPETKYPGAVEDCYAGLAWLHRSAAEFDIDPSRIAIGGESAGGGLAAALALLARDRRTYPIAFQHLVFPMIDDRTAVRDDIPSHIGQYVWTPAKNRVGWSALLDAPPGDPSISCYAAAARARDLAGLPPTFMICGALDLFIEENIEYARRLVLAGVPTEFHILPGAPHAYQWVAEARVSRESARLSMAAFSRVFGAAG